MNPEIENSNTRQTKFVIEFLRVEHVQNDAQFFVTWGHVKSKRTPVVVSSDGVARFSGATYQSDTELHRSKKYDEFLDAPKVRLRLRCKRKKHLDRTFAETYIDLSRHFGDWQTEIHRRVGTGLWSKTLRKALMEPVIVMRVSCSWNDPALRQEQPQPERPQQETRQQQAQPATTQTASPAEVPPTRSTPQPQQQQQQQQQEAPLRREQERPKSPQHATPASAKSPPPSMAQQSGIMTEA